MSAAVAAQVKPESLLTLPIWFEVLWMTVNCVFGAAVTRSRKAPIYGTLFGGVLVGLGGGITRDVLLGLEPTAIAVWYYLPVGVVGGVAGALLFDWITAWPLPVLLLQGVTLGFLVTIGVQKAIAYDAPWFSAMALGVITASFGGLVADVMTGNRATVAKQAHWVASALVVGATSFWVAEQLGWLVAPSAVSAVFWIATAVAVVAVTALRVLSVRRGWPCPDWPERGVQPA